MGGPGLRQDAHGRRCPHALSARRAAPVACGREGAAASMDGASQRNGGGRQREGGKQREGRSGLRRAGREYLEMPQGQGKDRSDCLHLFVVAGREYLEMPPHFEAGEVRVQVPPGPRPALTTPVRGSPPARLASTSSSLWRRPASSMHRRCRPYSHRQPARLPCAHQGPSFTGPPGREPRFRPARHGSAVRGGPGNETMPVKRQYWSNGDASQRR